MNLAKTSTKSNAKTRTKSNAKANTKARVKSSPKSSAKSNAKSSVKTSTKSSPKKAKTPKMPNTKLIKNATDSNFLSLMSLDSALSANEPKKATRKIKSSNNAKSKNTTKTPPKNPKKASAQKNPPTKKSTTKQTATKKSSTKKTTTQNLSKQKQIISMFDSIAKDYDRANHLLSLGIDISWRIDACKRAYQAFASKNMPKEQKSTPKKQSGLMIADIACGTGDMLLQWHKEAKKSNIALDSLIGIDPSKQMLKIAQNKIKNKLDKTSKTKILIKIGEAKDLSTLKSGSIDILSISYGLRNVLEYDKALGEFARVLKPNGVLVVLDFFKKPNPSLLDKIVGIYTRIILPFIGWAISRNFEAYKYLPDSMDSFVSPQKLADDLGKLGFEGIQIKGYSANISHLILGIKS
ncbi:bifunctional demethylmenaquinone methyltransferase/2-methoxy-6-polyprenyl-1,4-benzoquinol methylase UbiE [Helicobacter sp. T3_23-1056]